MSKQGLNTYYQSKEIGFENKLKNLKKIGASNGCIRRMKNKFNQDIKKEKLMDVKLKSKPLHNYTFGIHYEPGQFERIFGKKKNS